MARRTTFNSSSRNSRRRCAQSRRCAEAWAGAAAPAWVRARLCCEESGAADHTFAGEHNRSLEAMTERLVIEVPVPDVAAEARFCRDAFGGILTTPDTDDVIELSIGSSITLRICDQTNYES